MIRLPRQILRALLLSLGSLMLLFGVWHLLAPRAQYVSSHPAPGSVLGAPPGEVSVSFSEELAAESTIAVTSTITLLPTDEAVYSEGKRFSARGPTSDPQRRTLRVELEPGLPAGLYWVQWTAVTTRGKAQRYGTMCFGVGMPVPDHITRDMQGALRERDHKFRSRRAALLGGIFLIALGTLLPLLPVRGGR